MDQVNPPTEIALQDPQQNKPVVNYRGLIVAPLGAASIPLLVGMLTWALSSLLPGNVPWMLPELMDGLVLLSGGFFLMKLRPAFVQEFVKWSVWHQDCTAYQQARRLQELQRTNALLRADFGHDAPTKT